MILFVSLLLALWFWRANFKDGTVWMAATYLGVGFLLWQNFDGVAVAGGKANEALPSIVRDFLLLGMVGFIQSLAVNKRMPIWLAVVLTLGIFAAAHFLDFKSPSEESSVASPQTETPYFSDIVAPVQGELDPNGEFLVEMEEEYSLADLQRTATSRGWSFSLAFAPEASETTFLDNYYTVDTDGNRDDAQAILKAVPGVVYLEPNEIITVEPLISEDGIGSQRRAPGLSIDDPSTDEQWIMDVMKMEGYYRLLATQTPVKKAKIAILDTGVDGNHEDLKANYFSVDDKYDNDPMGHGTHCAGIAAGVTNNGIGIGSMAGFGKQPFVEVTSIKVLKAGGMGTQKGIIAGIIEAADEGADIISLSLGGPSNSSRQKAYSQAVKYAIGEGAIVVSAAGNSNADAKNYSPANATDMISVAAIDGDLKRASFSNTVDRLKQGIAAPGVAIYSTTPDNNYKIYSGTSMACPFVAGLLGVMRSLNPELTAAQAYKILKRTGIDGPDSKVTGRIVQPEAAIRAVLR